MKMRETTAASDLPRPKTNKQLRMHMSLPEGGLLCKRRDSYQQTEDRERVTCPTCLAALKNNI